MIFSKFLFKNRKIYAKKKGRNRDKLKEIMSNFKFRICKSIFIKFFYVVLYIIQQIRYSYRENYGE